MSGFTPATLTPVARPISQIDIPRIFNTPVPEGPCHDQRPGNGTKRERLTCSLTGRELPRQELVNLETVRDALVERIRRDHPELARDALVSRKELACYRALYVEELLKAERSDLSPTSSDRVTESLARHAGPSPRTSSASTRRSGRCRNGSRTSLRRWRAAGALSSAFCLALALWITFNALRHRPLICAFILLFLLLSCVAARPARSSQWAEA